MFIKRLNELPEGEKRFALDAYLEKILGDMLLIEDEEDVDFETGFFDLGLTSLQLIEIVEILQKELGCNLQSQVMFNYPNLPDLSDYLIEQVLVSH